MEETEPEAFELPFLVPEMNDRVHDQFVEQLEHARRDRAIRLVEQGVDDGEHLAMLAVDEAVARVVGVEPDQSIGHCALQRTDCGVHGFLF